MVGNQLELEVAVATVEELALAGGWEADCLARLAWALQSL